MVPPSYIYLWIFFSALLLQPLYAQNTDLMSSQPLIHGKVNGMDVMAQGDAVAFMAAGKAGSLLAEMDEETCERDLHCTMQKNNTRAIVLNPEGIWIFDSPSKQLPDNVTVTESLYPVSTEADLFAGTFIKPTSTYIPLEGSPPLHTLHTGNEMVDSSPVREWLAESLTTHENVTITDPVLPVSGQDGLVQTEPQMPPSAIHISSEIIQPSPTLTTLNTGIPYIDQSPAIALVNQATMEWLADWVNISKSRTALSESTDYPDDSVSLLPPVRSSSSSGAVMLTTLTDDRFATLTTLRPTPAPQPVLNLVESYEKEIAAEVRLEFEQNLLTIQPSPTQANSGSSGTYQFSYQPRQVPETAEGQSKETSQAIEATTQQMAISTPTTNMPTAAGSPWSRGQIYQEDGYIEENTKKESETIKPDSSTFISRVGVLESRQVFGTFEHLAKKANGDDEKKKDTGSSDDSGKSSSAQSGTNEDSSAKQQTHGKRSFDDASDTATKNPDLVPVMKRQKRDLSWFQIAKDEDRKFWPRDVSGPVPKLLAPLFYHYKETEQVSKDEAEKRGYRFGLEPDNTIMIMTSSCRKELIKRGVSEEEIAELSSKSISEKEEYVKSLKESYKKTTLGWSLGCFYPLYDENTYFVRRHFCHRLFGTLQLDGRYIADPSRTCECGRHRRFEMK